ncbi:hypothetical protein RI129_011641 [Pyrocoelia pectoralis]|uniref:Uncharacterized protein n=1 Tax=Pyrocoelia pectoralis TaxID=417401 RepID=A0AAN7V8A2_9COLE
MKVRRVIGIFTSIFLCLSLICETSSQEPSFELPVELIGFPAVILFVRLSNFAKKLAYSLNPRTYASRTRRSIESDDMIDIEEAEKRLIFELGEKVCIYPKVCLYHALKASQTQVKDNVSVDWNDIFSQYKTSKEKHKEYYLLSIFLGDIVASPRFCNQLVKKGRACKE